MPKKSGSWSVSWLEGSAFPSWSGNSVLTSHVYLANGLPNPFVNLNQLKYGDAVIVHAYSQKYTFGMQTNQAVLKHEEKPVLALVTCKDYDEQADTYLKRVVLIRVE